MKRVYNRINRTIAYILIPLFLLMAVTGFVTGGKSKIMERGISALLHQEYLNIIFTVLVTVHTLFGIHIMLARRKIKGKLINSMLIAAGFVVITGFTVISLI